MFAFLAPLLLKLSPIGSIFKAVPRWVWIAIGVIAAIGIGYAVHQAKAHAALKAADKAGYVRARTEDQAAIDKARAAAVAWKQKADTANSTIHQEEQSLHEQAVADNSALANDIRVRIQQRAQAQPRSGGGATLSGSPAASILPGGPRAGADAAVAESADPAVCIDANKLLDYAEQADNDHDALIRTEDQQKRVEANWPKATAQPPK